MEREHRHSITSLMWIAVTCLPLLSILIGLFWGGIFSLATELNLNSYRELIQNPWFWDSLLYTSRIALVSTIVSAICGLGVAVGLTLLPSMVLRRLSQLPLLIPHIITAHLLVILLAKSGWLARLLYQAGVIQQQQGFPNLLYDGFGWSVILGFGYKETFFVAFMIFPYVQRVWNVYGKVSHSLGQPAGVFIVKVLVPLVWPALATTSLLVFAYCFASFEIPYVLGNSYPKTLTMRAYEMWTSPVLSTRQPAAALAVVICSLTCLVAAVYFWSMRHWQPRLELLRRELG